MFELKCISREAFENNPHYVVLFDSKFVVTIWQENRTDGQRKIWSFVGNPGFLKHSEEFDTVEKALDFIKKNWAPESKKS